MLFNKVTYKLSTQSNTHSKGLLSERCTSLRRDLASGEILFGKCNSVWVFIPQGCAVESAYNINKDVQIHQKLHEHLLPDIQTVRKHEIIIYKDILYMRS